MVTYHGEFCTIPEGDSNSLTFTHADTSEASCDSITVPVEPRISQDGILVSRHDAKSIVPSRIIWVLLTHFGLHERGRSRRSVEGLCGPKTVAEREVRPMLVAKAHKYSPVLGLRPMLA